ncbi:hypothetical protein EVA_12313 [gut metagenome]|uniref:Uncharacterized protein n=1 Tax=gut metagenome TaxID=749906 RepID=J9CHS0_9ZZZZ
MKKRILKIKIKSVTNCHRERNKYCLQKIAFICHTLSVFVCFVCFRLLRFLLHNSCK